MAVMVRYASQSLSIGSILLSRSLLTLTALTILYFREIRSYFSSDSKNSWYRACFGSISLSCYYFSLKYLDTLNAALITLLAPVFLLVLSRVYMDERLSARQYIGIFLIVLIETFVNFKGFNSSLETKGIVIGIVGSVFMAISFLFLKMASRVSSTNNLIFSLHALLFFVSLPFLSYTPAIPSFLEWMYLLGIALSAYLGQVFLVKVYCGLSASLANISSKMFIVWIFLIDWLIVGKPFQVEKTATIIMTIAALTLIFYKKEEK
ncbi:MAG: DMT family transporter [Bdellovibrio sp.]|nr:DMT family transporter [Bdellovibrio sp.]